MLNFTVGPVQECDEVRAIGAEQTPYFRTAEFSAMMLENERLIKKLAGAPEDARAVFLTGSGTASMEAAVMNKLTPRDRVLVVNGGSFGHRFVELCALHDIPHTEIRLEMGRALRAEHLAPYEGAGYTGLVVNLHETSTGVLYDLELISAFCRRNGLLLVVDAISAFLADPFNMAASGVDVMISSSQKALACPPGVSMLVLSARAVRRAMESETRCMYLNLKSALVNGERGQTPFTPAVSVLRQLHARLCAIDRAGGAETEIARTSALARDFRQKMQGLPLEVVSEALSNAVTPLHPLHVSAYEVFLTLKDEYGIWICPNGGETRDTVFRVGHIGNLTEKDNTTLVEALKDLKRRGRL